MSRRPPAAQATDARDPGLQPERTALAWQRTALSVAMVALLLGFACLRGGFLIGTGIAALIAIGAGAALFLGRRRAARRTSVSPWTPLTRIAVLVLATAAVGAVLAVIVLL